MERLRSSRSQLVDHFRSAGDAMNNNKSSLQTAMRVQDVMEVEWVAMSPDSGFPLARCVEDNGKGEWKCLVKFLYFGVYVCKLWFVWKVFSFSQDDSQEDDEALLELMEEIQQELISEGETTVVI